jgi:prephenate dehydrogenase
VLDRAHERGALDERAADPQTLVEDADVVVLATPVGTSLRMLKQIAPHLAKGAIVTDVASVKSPVMDQAAEVLPDHVHFVGGHPMAGAEKSGIDAADALLFENAIYALCLADDDASALEGPLSPLVELVEATGARPLLLEADHHDRIAAWVSHLPQLLAVALMNLVDDLDDATARQLAAGGFRDMTRIASSPFEMWRDIVVGNQGPILDALGAMARSIQSLRNRLIEDDLDALDEAFDQASKAREGIPSNQKGFLQPLYDVLVRAEDQPGELHAITGTLLNADLNVRDVELLKFREGTGGTFRLGFSSADEAEAACNALNANDFEARPLE